MPADFEAVALNRLDAGGGWRVKQSLRHLLAYMVRKLIRFHRLLDDFLAVQICRPQNANGVDRRHVPFQLADLLAQVVPRRALLPRHERDLVIAALGGHDHDALERQVQPALGVGLQPEVASFAAHLFGRRLRGLQAVVPLLDFLAVLVRARDLVAVLEDRKLLGSDEGGGGHASLGCAQSVFGFPQSGAQHLAFDGVALAVFTKNARPVAVAELLTQLLHSLRERRIKL